MKVLITGGAGFIGSHLVEDLNNLNVSCMVIDNLSSGTKSNINNLKCVFIEEDILNSKLSSVIKNYNPDIVFHFAAQTSLTQSIKDPKKDIEINLFGTLNLLKSLNNLNIKKIIFASSAAVYGDTKKVPIQENFPINPYSMYGISKLSSEILIAKWANENSIKYANLRFANVYGERQDSTAEGGVVAIFINRILSSKTLKIYSDGKQTRDFVYVQDVVSALVKVLNKNLLGTFNIGTTKETEINELANLLEKISKKTAVKIHKKHDLVEVRRSSLSYDKILKTAGWNPKVSLNDGLKKTYAYFKLKTQNK